MDQKLIELESALYKAIGFGDHPAMAGTIKKQAFEMCEEAIKTL